MEVLNAQPAQQVMGTYRALRSLLHCQVAKMPLIDLSVFGHQGTIAERAKAAARSAPWNLADESCFTFGRDACKKLGHCSNSQKHMSTSYCDR
jgi:hypothetical protein